MASDRISASEEEPERERGNEREKEREKERDDGEGEEEGEGEGEGEGEDGNSEGEGDIGEIGDPGFCRPSASSCSRLVEPSPALAGDAEADRECFLRSLL